MNPILLQMASGAAADGKNGTATYIIMMVVLIALMYFMMIRPQKKRQKEEQEMRSSLEIGDEIITIGGIVGKVVTIREEDLIIETGADRNKMRIQRWAINTNVTKTEQHKKEVEKAPFTSLKNTKSIEVIISGQKDAAFDFVVTNLKLEANSIPTAWEIAIEDMEDALNTKVGNTPEEVFESLTDGGKMQGVYVDTDEHGNKNYYFNASYIKSGQISGEYINAKNLTVTRKDGVETLKVDNNGNVTIRGNIQIQGDSGFNDAASVEDIAYKVEIISTNGTVFSNGQVQTELIAKAFKGQEDITNSLTNDRFQ